MSRKITQIAGSDNRIYALCEDGTLWEMNQSGEWDQHPPIPEVLQPKVEAKSTVDMVWFCMKPDIMGISYELIYWTKPDRSDRQSQDFTHMTSMNGRSPVKWLEEKFPHAMINSVEYSPLDFYDGKA